MIIIGTQGTNFERMYITEKESILKKTVYEELDETCYAGEFKNAVLFNR